MHRKYYLSRFAKMTFSLEWREYSASSDFSLMDGWLYTYSAAEALIAAAGRLPPGALNLQGAPTFVDFWRNINGKNKNYAQW